MRQQDLSSAEESTTPVESSPLYLPAVGTAPAQAQAKLGSLGWLLMVYAPLDSATLASSLPAGSPGQWRAILLSAGGLLALGLASRKTSRRLATGLTLGLLAAAYLWIFPGNSNHRFLVLMCLGVLVFVDLEEEKEAFLGLAVLRWMTVLVLYYTGVQKLLYGTYFHAEFLSWQVAWEPRFARVFGELLPAAELARLQGMASAPFDEQLYRTTAPALLLAAWATLALELALPVFLVLRRTRKVAVALTLALLVGIETAALELSFGVVFVSLVLLFTRENWNRRVLPFFTLILAAVFLGRVGLVPWGGLN